MILTELKDKLKSLNLPIAYRCFAVGQVPELPYIVYYVDEDIGFDADDTVYYEGYAVTIEVYTDRKVLQLEIKVTQLLKNNELQYESYESFLESENMYLKAYEIEI